MFSKLYSVFNYFFGVKESEEDDETKEDFLAEQLLDLEATSANKENESACTDQPAATIPRNTICYQRTGIITYKDENYVLIDGMLYFDLSTCNIRLSMNDKILYLCYKDSNDSVIVVRILENQGLSWEEDGATEEKHYKIIEHVVVGEVEKREERFVFIINSDLKFDLDDVVGSFVPVTGDWLELTCTVQYDNDNPTQISTKQILQVVSFKPIRSKVKTVLVTSSNGSSGIFDKLIFFDKQCIKDSTDLQVGQKFIVEAIESNQGTCTWRAIKAVYIPGNDTQTVTNIQTNEEEESFKLENEKKISITHPIRFEKVDFQKTASIKINITNNSDEIYTLNKWIMLSKKRDSQVDIKPFLNRPLKLYPKQTFNFNVTCYPKFLGNSKECLIFMFRGFQFKRYIEINIVDNTLVSNGYKEEKFKSEKERINMMKNVRRNGNNAMVPGVRPIKPPAFIPVRMGMFPIPEKIWAVVLGDSDQTIHSSDYEKILERLEINLPCLSQDLNIGNYIDKFHTLLYIEEIQVNISMRAHDTPKTFLIRCQEYLGHEIPNLSEKRPSLIKGDRVIVKDIWNSNAPNYEGYIHAIKGNLVLMKLNPNFHESYSGSDVSIEFHFSRSVYRRAHQAINLALSNLGPDILFPTRVLTRPLQVEPHSLQSMSWFNKKLNAGQKAAVTNIILGECRPMPYCIFGPPGTGKTVTVIETILQILTQLPDSRILVAAPSNSAANLITERLLEYTNSFSGSIIRLIANYLLDSDSIPEQIKPFCATMDISLEESSRMRYEVKNGVHLNCQTSFIGRHRVTIGTCYCIGTLAQMGLPKGHFTHIIIDEAGQATEPEIMIPMTFIDKENGQIIIAGDPMQLGPVVMSRYSKEYGLDESYLSRVLECFPYQKDFTAYENGFNKKLITKLNDNYRSLKGVLQVPSELFYDSSLVDKFDTSASWIPEMTKAVAEVFDSNVYSGGIYVFGIKGYNSRAEDSPSWYNPQEAAMVSLATCKLYKRGVTADDIGIITPYIAQIKYLRVLFEAMGLPEPKIGTVEEFQGQERRIILISTVRSTESLVNEDIKHSLGFVKSPKRLNVAITRAQIAVLLFCNPHLLCTDSLWNKVIENAIVNDKYMGCDLPLKLNNCRPDNDISTS